tara:strand:+ start:839 stop:1132 length:294 start_codon:yes stop_codon:yes gene_type:complete
MGFLKKIAIMAFVFFIYFIISLLYVYKYTAIRYGKDPKSSMEFNLSAYFSLTEYVSKVRLAPQDPVDRIKMLINQLSFNRFFKPLFAGDSDAFLGFR